MAVLFVVALLLIVWQARRTKPLSPPGFPLLEDPRAQVFPIGVPSWRAALAVPANPAERFQYLEGNSVHAAEPGPASACRLFLRVSAHHWYERPVSLEMLSPGHPAPGGTAVWFLPPLALLDDDDGDGDPLDRGELTPDRAGAAAEVFCPPFPPEAGS